jgi:hypothetical protein
MTLFKSTGLKLAPLLDAARAVTEVRFAGQADHGSAAPCPLFAGRPEPCRELMDVRPSSVSGYQSFKLRLAKMTEDSYLFMVRGSVRFRP